MKEISESEVDWAKNNCPSCGGSGKWRHPLAFNHNELCDDICLFMECNHCEFLYDGVVWESKGKWYEKD